MVRTVKARLRSVKPVLMTVTVETRYDIIDVGNYIKIKDDYDKNEKNVLLMTALMMAAAQSNDPFRTPRRNTGGFDVMIINGSRNPLFVS